MTEPCMFPNLHEPFYCRIHADVRLRLTDERCRRGVTLTQPQPAAGYVAEAAAWYRKGREDALRSAPAAPDLCPKCGKPRHDMEGDGKGFHAYLGRRSTPAAPKNPEDGLRAQIRAALKGARGLALDSDDTALDLELANALDALDALRPTPAAPIIGIDQVSLATPAAPQPAKDPRDRPGLWCPSCGDRLDPIPDEDGAL